MLVNHGQIRSMETPPGWRTFGLEHINQSTQTVVRYVFPKDPRTQLLFRYRGYAVNESSGRRFLQLLNDKCGLLSSSECDLIGDVINCVDVDANFSLLAARVELLSGRKVLVLRGRWWCAHVDVMSVYFPADSAGCYIQEIHFLGPSDQYASNQLIIKRALNTIRWTENNVDDTRTDSAKVFCIRSMSLKP